uniref:Si:ch211-232p21.6 n=1 Tax=Electrophorus electricus TaxID=8005 RepID=A0A4W4FTR7_ELEEL
MALSVLLILSLLCTVYIFNLQHYYYLLHSEIMEMKVQDKDRLYVFSEIKMSWNSSRMCCQELGGDLAIVNSREEHEFLAGQVESIGESDHYWIGLTDAQSEGMWLWVDHSPLLENLTWWKYVPDDWKEHDPSGEDCVIYVGGKWADVSCSSSERRICELPHTSDTP